MAMATANGSVVIEATRSGPAARTTPSPRLLTVELDHIQGKFRPSRSGAILEPSFFRTSLRCDSLDPVDNSLSLLIDAPSLFFRAFFSTPDTVQTPEGVPINAAHGFLYMLARLITDHRPDYLACAADEDWRPQWRVDLIPSYKTARAQADSAQAVAEDVLGPQVPVLYALLDLIGIKVVGHPKAEAEDVIGTLAERAPGRVGIVSGDRDLFQLVVDPRVTVLYPVRGVSKVDVVNESYIATKYGIPGRAYKDYAILRGDASDGLPGVTGIGEKHASALIAKHGSIDSVIAAADEGAQSVLMDKIRRDLDYVRRAVEVVTIQADLAIPEVDLRLPGSVDEETVMAGAKRLGLTGPVTALLEALR
jgi:5'-3' exonuclease